MKFTTKDCMVLFLLFASTVFVLSALLEKTLQKIQSHHTRASDETHSKSTQGVVMSLVSQLQQLTRNSSIIQLFQNHTRLGPDRPSNEYTVKDGVSKKLKEEINLFDYISQPRIISQRMRDKLENPSILSHEPPIMEPGNPLINRRVAEEVSKKVRVLCWIPSSEKFKARLNAVNATWVKRCDKVIFIISNPTFKSHDTLGVDMKDSRATLNDKTVFAHRHIHKYYLDKYDWFLKADDDTYVIMENLKFLLSHFDLKTPGYVGCQLRHYSPQGYMNGGAGYAFNALGIKAIVEQGYNIPGRCRLHQGAEDIENGYCANKAGVKTFDQLDINGKQTFLSSSVYENVVGPLPTWTNSNLVAHAILGLNCCSHLVVSFHHADEKLMLIMEFLIYKVAVHGRVLMPEISRGMFTGKEAPEIPKSLPRRAYPGEVVGDYYEGKDEWRKSNVTAHDKQKMRNVGIHRRERARHAAIAKRG